MARFMKLGVNALEDVPGGCSDPQCQYVILSKDEYMQGIDRINWAEDLVKKKKILLEGMVAITEEERNGYEKAVRVVRDRGVQQIDKSKADEHGYRLLRADQRKYGRRGDIAWLITKSTPYSLKMGLEDAFYMIERDLRDFYHMRVLPDVSENPYYVKKLDVPDLLNLHKRFFRDRKDSVQVKETSRVLDWMAETNGVVVFEISKVAQNAASGCYEVSYWATAPI